MDLGTIKEAFSGLTLQETQRTVEIVICDMPERKEGCDGEREERWDGDNTEKKEIEEGEEEGIDSESEKTKNEEERVKSSDNDSEKIGTEYVKEEIDGDDDNVDTEKREEMIDDDSDNVKTESDSNIKKKKIKEKEQGRSTDGEGKVGDREQTIDCVSEHEEIEEKSLVGDSGSERKEIGEKEEETDSSNEDKGEEGEEKEGGEKISKERVKFRINYPQRPFTPDCPAYLKTGYCSYGLVCWFNHPLRKSGTVSPNRDCKERERDDGQEKKELVGRGKVPYAQPYPQREGKEDCLFYLNTGHCSSGAHCCFNHPPRTLNQFTEDIKGQNVPDGKNDPTEADTNWATGPSLAHIRRRSDCVRYVKEGRCDNGAECKFFHHRSRRPYEFNLNPRSCWKEKLELETNFLGLPLRPGRDDCPEYITHGACKLSTACQYNHPNPDPVIDIQDTDKAFHIGDSLPSLEEHAALVPSPTCRSPHNIKPMFIPTSKPSLAQIKQMLLPPERPDIGDGCKELQTQRSSSSSLEGSRDIHGVTTTRSNGSGCELLEHPARPGEPLCPAYMKSGDCKLKSECWYDHPRDQHPKDPAKPSVQSNGYNRDSSTKEMVNGPMMPEEGSIYPERPGEPECAYYIRFGDCKFRSACKFHHPKHLRNKTPTFSLQASRGTSVNGCEEMEYPERPGQPECAYYMMHGNCKFGWNCKFHHPKGRDEKKSSQWGYRNLGPTRNFQNGPGH